MKVTFLIPPVLSGDAPAERTSGCTHVVYATPNIYELTVAALLEEQPGVEVCYRDFVLDKGSREALSRFLAEDDSDLYSLWAVNLSLENDLQVAQLIHDLRPAARVLFVGPGPTYFTQRCLTDERNIVVRGEVDDTAKDVALALRDGKDWRTVEGISYLQDGQIHHNRARAIIKDLDARPLPARHLIAHYTYHNPKLKTGPYTVALTSRGCPYQCIYCVPSSLTFAREIDYRRDHGRKPPVAKRSVESVERELAQLEAEGYRAVGFMDDNFIWDEKRTLALCQALRKHGFVWGCQARADAITEPIAKALSESGCLYVDLGVESFNDDILRYIKKGLTAAQIEAAIALLKQYGVPVKLNILIGSSPLETRQTLRDTLRRAKRLKVDQIMFNIVSPFPGTEFYTLAKENGWLSTPDYVPTDVQRHSNLNLPHLSAREMERILFRSNVAHFLSPRFVWTQLRRFSSMEEFWYALRALKIKLFG